MGFVHTPPFHTQPAGEFAHDFSFGQVQLLPQPLSSSGLGEGLGSGLGDGEGVELGLGLGLGEGERLGQLVGVIVLTPNGSNAVVAETSRRSV